MKIQDLEKISEYIDGESRNSLQIHSLIESDPLYKKAYQNLLIVSDIIRHLGKSYIPKEEIQTNVFWNALAQKFNEEDSFLSSVLQLAYKELPQEYNNLDLWQNIEEKLNTSTNSFNTAEQVLKPIANELPSLNNLLSESLNLPEQLANIDIWANLEEKIDEQYHSEIFSESQTNNLSAKAKFFIGLSEYADGEVLAEKAQIINDHLIACSNCRNHYLALVKSKDALKFAYKDFTPGILSANEFWTKIEQQIFPETIQAKSKKVQGL